MLGILLLSFFVASLFMLVGHLYFGIKALITGKVAIWRKLKITRVPARLIGVLLVLGGISAPLTDGLGGWISLAIAILLGFLVMANYGIDESMHGLREKYNPPMIPPQEPYPSGSGPSGIADPMDIPGERPAVIPSASPRGPLLPTDPGNDRAVTPVPTAAGPSPTFRLGDRPVTTPVAGGPPSMVSPTMPRPAPAYPPPGAVPQAPVAVPLAYLRVANSPLPLSSLIPITKDNFTVGRGDGNDLQLLDVSASRRHVRLRFAQGVWYIQDQGTKGGTFVNKQQVKAGRLNPGDEIRIGNSTFVFQLKGD